MFTLATNSPRSRLHQVRCLSWLAAFLISAVVQGCHIAPPYAPPQMTAPPAYKEAASASPVNWAPAQPSDIFARGKWWTLFHDPQLDQLEDKVDTGNQSIAAAYGNYNAARAVLRELRSHYFPTISAAPTFGNTRVSVVPEVAAANGITYSEYTFPIEASWEPDLFGSVRNNVHSAAFTAQSENATLESMRLAMHAQLAMDYLLLRSQDSLIDVLDSTVNTQQDTLTITINLMNAGLTTDEAVAAAESQLDATRAQLDGVRIARAQYEHAIAMLIGEAPAMLTIANDPLNIHPPQIPATVPSALLQRRPDIAASERAVAAANAQVGVARSAYFPQLTLTGDAGLMSLSLASWFTWPSRFWEVGATAAESIFDAGLRKATVSEYRARMDVAVATYRQTVLSAFQQVEDELIATQLLNTERSKQEQAVAAAERALGEAQVRYRAGLDPYINVLQAQQTVLTYRQTAVQLQAQQVNAAVQLIQALGGGWDTTLVPTTKQVAQSR